MPLASTSTCRENRLTLSQSILSTNVLCSCNTIGLSDLANILFLIPQLPDWLIWNLPYYCCYHLGHLTDCIFQLEAWWYQCLSPRLCYPSFYEVLELQFLLSTPYILVDRSWSGTWRRIISISTVQRSHLITRNIRIWAAFHNSRYYTTTCSFIHSNSRCSNVSLNSPHHWYRLLCAQ